MRILLLCWVLLMPILAFTGCEKDDELNILNQTLNVGQTYTIPINGVWESDNKFIAIVTDQTVKGKCAGVCKISNGKQSFNVTVTPIISLYKDPYLNFEASELDVRKEMIDFEGPIESNKSLEYFYMNGSYPVMYLYNFANKKLESTLVSFPTSMATSPRLVAYLTERFVPVGSNGDISALVSPDKNIAVGVTVKNYKNTLMYFIMYFPFTGTKSNGSDILLTIENHFQDSLTIL